MAVSPSAGCMGSKQTVVALTDADDRAKKNGPASGWGRRGQETKEKRYQRRSKSSPVMVNAGLTGAGRLASERGPLTADGAHRAPRILPSLRWGLMVAAGLDVLSFQYREPR
jgi:hypothetical protein